MKITYDPAADAMYIYLKEEKVTRSKEIDKNTIIDLNGAGEVIGVEILFVRERNPNLLKEFQIENFVPA